jgi:hypothetical protein
VAGAAVGLLVGPSALAVVETYDSQAEWLAALGGPTSFSEDFEGFEFDLDFREAPVAADGFSLVQTGSNFYEFRNFIDTPAFAHSDNNGTNHASMYVNLDASVGNTGVRLQPDASLVAWSGGFSIGSLTESLDLVLNLAGGGSMTLSPDFVGGGTEEFFGFIASADMAVASIDFVARNYLGDPVGEGFGLDNVAGSFLPAPSALALLVLGGLAPGRSRRRRA